MEINDELKEHAEKAEGPFDKRVAVSMAVIAAFLALVSVAGHLATTEELLNQQKASDTWAFYQAKSIRAKTSEVARDLFAVQMGEPAKKMSDYYSKEVARYRNDGEDLQDKAKELVKESELEGNRAKRFHVGEIFLEIAIVFSSLAILTKRPMFWWMGIVSSLIGIGVASTAYLLH